MPMNDPHVERLFYKLHTGDNLSFNAPPPLEGGTRAFRLRLENDELTAEILEHYPTEASARQRLESYLRAWEISANLDLGVGSIRFEFERADVIDRDPHAPVGSRVFNV